jgi:hypothetical protein
MPVGAYFGRGTPQTHMLFPEVWKELDADFMWSSECYNDDVPYWIDLPWEKELPESERKGMLLIPYSVHSPTSKIVRELTGPSMTATTANSTCLLDLEAL